jgi:hypothetical protein
MMIQKNILSVIAAVLLFCSCNGKKKQSNSTEKNFPVLGFIQSQVSDVDTSMYSIYKITIIDTLQPDTVFIPREQFREAARDFLNIPDISSPDFEGRYKEDKKFDADINKGIMVYTPISPAKEEIQQEQILVTPEGDQVTSIYIEWVKNTKDSSIEKKMLWRINKSFQVVTTRQLPGQAETISTLRVLWNGDEGQ